MLNKSTVFVVAGVASFLTGFGLTIAGMLNPEDGHAKTSLYIPGAILTVGTPVLAILIGAAMAFCKKEEEEYQQIGNDTHLELGPQSSLINHP